MPQPILLVPVSSDPGGWKLLLEAGVGGWVGWEVLGRGRGAGAGWGGGSGMGWEGLGWGWEGWGRVAWRVVLLSGSSQCKSRLEKRKWAASPAPAA